jgi:hypothetical protein
MCDQILLSCINNVKKKEEKKRFHFVTIEVEFLSDNESTGFS